MRINITFVINTHLLKNYIYTHNLIDFINKKKFKELLKKE